MKRCVERYEGAYDAVRSPTLLLHNHSDALRRDLTEVIIRREVGERLDVRVVTLLGEEFEPLSSTKRSGDQFKSDGKVDGADGGGSVQGAVGPNRRRI